MIFFAGSALCLAWGAAALAAADTPAKPATLASGTFATSAGAAAGTASVVVPARGNPVLRVKVSGLPAGVHGIHIHTTGKCEGPAFTTAGGHLNPSGHQHGKDNPAGPHAGDLPNIEVSANGVLAATVTLPGASLTGPGPAGVLLDGDGASLVIHAGPDD
jgi:Cu-Zn family superoxide dismutase